MAPASKVSVSREVAAPAERVFALLSDLPRMGEWSPETLGGRWVGGATGPAVGAVFKGRNANGWRRWSTRSTVTAYQPSRLFEFSVSGLGLPGAIWRYEFEETPGGCRVTESWTDRRGWLLHAVGAWALRVPDRPEHNRRGMEATLAKVAAAAEAGAGAGPAPAAG